MPRTKPRFAIFSVTGIVTVTVHPVSSCVTFHFPISSFSHFPTSLFPHFHISPVLYTFHIPWPSSATVTQSSPQTKSWSIDDQSIFAAAGSSQRTVRRRDEGRGMWDELTVVFAHGVPFTSFANTISRVSPTFSRIFQPLFRIQSSMKNFRIPCAYHSTRRALSSSFASYACE